MPAEDNVQVAADPNQQNQNQGPWALVKTVVKQMLIFYFISQVTSGLFKSKTPTTNNQNSGDSQLATPNSSPGNLFPRGSILDMYVYLSESDYFDDFSDPKALYWHIPALEYGNWNLGPLNDGVFTLNGNFELTKVIFFYKFLKIFIYLCLIIKTMQNNGSIYLHAFFTENGRSPNPKDKETYSKRKTFSSFKSKFFNLIF